MEKPETVFDFLLGALAGAAEYDSNDQVAPAAILWTDKERQWERLAPKLRAALPQFLTLGEYDPATRTGPAIWLRCMIERTLPGADWPESAVPVLYMPGVSRQDLRAVEGCPKHLQPLAELQYRGAFFTQTNARDWTILAFLQSKRGGLGLEKNVDQDSATIEAMKRALVKLADEKTETLGNRHLDAAFFDGLLKPDPVRDILLWLNDPQTTRIQADEAEWESFRSVCRKGYGFDPQTDGELVAAEELGKKEEAWQTVWGRFAESPRNYVGVTRLLRQARPSELTVDPSSWPQDNEQFEEELRKGLRALDGKSAREAAAGVQELEARHGNRRSWVWAELGLAPLARALAALSDLAEATKQNPGGTTTEDMAKAYADGGWKADAAVLKALGCVERNDDVEAVRAAIVALYRPWLEAGAERFQELAEEHPLPGKPEAEGGVPRPDAGTCILFADGLRFDVARMLEDSLRSRGFQVEISWRWAALPTVTPTTKPAASPIRHLITGSDSENEFRPQFEATGKNVTHDQFQRSLKDQDCAVLDENDAGDGSGVAWTECGAIDKYGHDQGWKLARRIGEELRNLVGRIEMLLEFGCWREVRVVTDHGWLLLPGGLPKADMPAYLAESRWGRCAVLRSGVQVEAPVVSWYWNPSVHIAVAPGIKCFRAGTEFAHGGLSLQECVVPEISVRRAAAKQPTATIASVKWVGLRCRIEVEGHLPGAHVDLRTKLNDPTTSLAQERQAQPVKEDGTAVLVVENDREEGTAASVVLLNESRNVLAKYPTTVGG